MDLFSIGFPVALSLSNLVYCFVGVFLGTFVGVLPGIGPLATIAILLPFTFYLDPTTAIIMLAGIYYGSEYGGSITSILLNVPGGAASAVTALDGYPMARSGRAGVALLMTGAGSFIGAGPSPAPSAWRNAWWTGWRPLRRGLPAEERKGHRHRPGHRHGAVHARRPEPARPAERPFTVTSIGRIAPVKRHEVLLEAVRRLRQGDDLLPLRVRLVGPPAADGAYAASLECRVREHGLEYVVRFVGHVVMPSLRGAATGGRSGQPERHRQYGQGRAGGDELRGPGSDVQRRPGGPARGARRHARRPPGCSRRAGAAPAVPRASRGRSAGPWDWSCAGPLSRATAWSAWRTSWCPGGIHGNVRNTTVRGG